MRINHLSDYNFVKVILTSKLYCSIDRFRSFFFPNLDWVVWSSSLTLREEIDNNINVFLSDKQLRNKKIIASYKKDIALCYFRYWISPNEYFVHQFREKSKKERKKYLSKKQKDIICEKKMTLVPFQQLNNKFAFYRMTSSFFFRDVCRIYEEKDLEDFVSFCKKHPRFIIKPTESSWGNGCKILENVDPYDCFKKLKKEGEWIVEELIQQDDRMAMWNPSSVNTIRINSFRQKDGSFKQIFPFFKAGRKGSIVDNGGQGGILASIDALTGIIVTNGLDEWGNYYTEHPDSHVKYIGWKIPLWKELIELSQKVHNVLPSNHIFVGFDFALSKKGWVLVEGNWGDWIAQQATHGRGLKKEFLEAING